MAIYHLSVKAISRSKGRSATAAAAYRAGCEIADERTGEIHDYTRKGGVESADIVLPDGAPEWAHNRAKLWNAAELAEKRKDACVAREFEVALPSELSPAERRRLALDFAQEMAELEGCAVDVAIHAPGRGGDNRNHHAHIMRTTRKVEAHGLGEKLDTEKSGRKRTDDLEAIRARWAELVNERLRENGITAQVDHRSLEAQGIERVPTRHLGPAATGYERRTGEVSRIRQDWQQEAAERLAQAKAAGEQERQSRQSDRLIIDLTTSLDAAKREREREQEQAAKEQAAKEPPAKTREQEVAEFWARMDQDADAIRQAAKDSLPTLKKQAKDIDAQLRDVSQWPTSPPKVGIFRRPDPNWRDPAPEQERLRQAAKALNLGRTQDLALGQWDARDEALAIEKRRNPTEYKRMMDMHHAVQREKTEAALQRGRELKQDRTKDRGR